MTELPFIDRHAVDVDASRDAVWTALCEALPRFVSAPGSGIVARVTGLRERGPTAVPFPSEGAVLLGFRVTRSTPPTRLLLEGRHRFSRYSLDFRLDEALGGSVLSAETRARFPGLAGRLYRGLVIGTGSHAVILKRLLRSVRRRAEGG